MPSVTSTAVDRVGYDPVTRVLDVRFASGACYSYLGVPPEVYEALLASSSIGAFVNEEVKPNYRFARSGRARRFAPV